MENSLFLSGVLAFLTAVSGQTERCPSHLPFTDRLAVYRGHCYQFVRVERFWDDARDFCWAHGGHLVHIRDSATNNFIVGQLSDLGWTNNGVWIGLHDRHDEMDWEWVGDSVSQPGLAVGWSNWGRGHPGAFLHSGRDCVRMKRSSGWRWHETSCHLLGWHYRFICVHPLTSTTPTPQTGGQQGGHNRVTTTTTTTTTTPTTTTTEATTTTTRATTTSKIDKLLWEEYQQNKGSYDVPRSQRLMSESEEKPNGMVYIIVGVAGGGLLVVVVAVVLLIRRRRQRMMSQPAIMDIQYPPKFDNPLYGDSEGGVAQALLNNPASLQNGNIYVGTKQMMGTKSRVECVEDPYLCPLENRESHTSEKCQASLPDDRGPLPARPSDACQAMDYLPMNGGDYTEPRVSHIYSEIPGGDPVNSVYQSLDDI